MITSRSRIAAGTGLAAALLALSALPAAAQRAPRPPADVTISNARQSPVTLLEIATTGEQPRLVAKLPQPLAPGQSTRLRLNRPAGCSYFVLVRFADDTEAESPGMDLCADRTIRLVD